MAQTSNYIITDQDIINTYDKRQQEQCRLHYKYKEIKQQNPSFGYKRIAKILGQQYGKTRWWHAGKHIPTPIQTADWLKEKDLLPLKVDHPKLTLIAKIIGSSFGDGGIFSNLNGIFLSSSELEAVKEFGDDLKKLFGIEIEKNSRIIEAGVYGHSWCYQNTNRNLIRFFIALGAPVGDKSLVALNIPYWIYLNEATQNEFFGYLFGNELSTPKIHPNNNSVTDLSFGITSTKIFENNKIAFLTEIKLYLNKKGIKTGKIYINDHKKKNRIGEPTKIYKLLISKTLENVTNFMTLTKLNYCKYKKDKLANTVSKFIEIKSQRFKNLLSMGYKEEVVLNLLKLTPKSLELLSNLKNNKENAIIQT